MMRVVKSHLTRLIALLVVSVAALADEQLTLDGYFAAAVKRSEAMASQTELIRQAEERLEQAQAARLPTLSGVGTYTVQESLPAGTTSTSSATVSPQTVAKLTATQPLFRGMREYAAVRQTAALRDAQNHDYQNARALLYRDVVQNFFAVLSMEQELRNVQAEITQHLEREQDIQARVRIGRARISELLNVQATVSTLRAQVEQLQGQLSTLREVFAFLSGLPAETALQDIEAAPAWLETLDSFLAGALKRPDVKAAQQRLSAAQESVTVARGAHAPSLDLNGNYYFERPDPLKDIHWDVQLALTIPLYAGGSVQSKVREAASQRTQAELAMTQVQRQAEQEIRSLYQSVSFNRAQVEALTMATVATRNSYEAQSREYRLGLVSNLEVLQALTAYQQNQRALDRARYSTKTDYVRLLVASARRPAQAEKTTP